MSAPSVPQALSAYAFGGSTMTMLLTGAQTDGAFAIVHIIKGAHSSTPLHSHQRETEISYVLEGRLGVETAAGTAYLDADECHVLAPGRAHRLFNDSSSEMREFLVCAPAIFDRFVETAGKPVEPFSAPEPMTDDARQRISSHAPDFELELHRQVPPEQIAQGDHASAEVLAVADGQWEVLAVQGDQDGDIALSRFTLQPGEAMPSMQVLDRQGLFLVKGELEIGVDSVEWTALTSRTAANVAAGSSYALRNTGDAAATVLIVSTVGTLRESARCANRRCPRFGTLDS